MRRIFFPAYNRRFDYAEAEKHGTVVFLLNNNGGTSPLRPQALVDAADEALRTHNYDPERDVIGLTGSTVMVATLLAVAVAKRRRVSVLVFDAAGDTYHEKDLSFEEASK